MMDDTIPEPDCADGAPHPRQTLSLYGQEQAEAAFLQAFRSDRLPHAWMITGPRGVGKATLAWRIARFLMARPTGGAGRFDESPPTPDSLALPPDHPVTRRISSLGEPGVFLCRRPWDAKAKRLSKYITVEQTRKLKSFFTLTAPDGGWRVALVDASDEMNPAAANALLKILEEPPEKTLIILVCHQPLALLPTIRSRCRVLRCGSLGRQDLGKALTLAGFEAGSAGQALEVLSEGSVGQAIRLLSTDGLEIYAQIVSLMSGPDRLDRQAVLKLANSCTGKAAEARYDMVLNLVSLFLSRLARFAALQPSQVADAAAGEARLMAQLAPAPGHARRWADLAQSLQARSSHARAVNLDPSGVILDMFLQLDATARN
jgi:DNA polymerase III subunit delta'